MVKKCPNCGGEFSRRKKNCCPLCGVAVFFDSNKEARLESDKTLADELLFELQQRIAKTRGSWFNMVVDPLERKFAYKTIDEVRAWVKIQNGEIRFSKGFLMEVLFTVMNDVWWAENVISCRQLPKQMVRKAPEVYNRELVRFRREAAERQRLNAQKGVLGVGFGL